MVLRQFLVLGLRFQGDERILRPVLFVSDSYILILLKHICQEGMKVTHQAYWCGEFVVNFMYVFVERSPM